MRNFLIPMGGFAAVAMLATVLIGVVLRSPDTHSNLWTTVQAGYSRTSPIYVGQEVALSLDVEHTQAGTLASMDPGRAIYLTRGCATCHGVDARGGPVGTSLAGSFPEIVKSSVREGRGGMPAYTEAHLSEADAATLAAYLQGVKVARPGPEDAAKIASLTWDPSVPRDMLLQGKAAIRRSCGACHAQPTKEEILSAFGSDSMATGLVAEMLRNTNLSLEDATAIAYYMMAILHGADPVQEP